MFESNSFNDLHLRLAKQSLEGFTKVYGEAVTLDDLKVAVCESFPPGMRTAETVAFVAKVLDNLSTSVISRQDLVIEDTSTGTVLDMAVKPEDSSNLGFIPNMELKLETQFAFIQLCKAYDGITDVDAIRELAKRSSKLGMIYQQMCGSLLKRDLERDVKDRFESAKRAKNLPV